MPARPQMMPSPISPQRSAGYDLCGAAFPETVLCRRLVALAALVAVASLPPIAAAAQTAAPTQGDVVQLETIEVQGQAAPIDTPPGTVGYTATETTAGTKTRTPAIEVPQSVTTVTRQQLNDRDVQTLVGALDYSPGVTPVYGYSPWVDWFYIRGFDEVLLGVYRDGLRQGGANFAIPRVEPYGASSVTILEGPASGLYGLGSPGGIVDVTTKRPTAAPFGEVQFQPGNDDRFQGNFDLGGPVAGDDRFSYRITGLFRDAKDWLPGGRDNRNYVAPAVTFRPDRDTSITILAEHMTTTASADSAFFSDATHRITPYFQGDPAYNTAFTEQYRIGYEAEHRFSDLLTIRQNFRYYHVDTDDTYTTINALDPSTNTALRSTGHVRDTVDEISLDDQAESHVHVGPVDDTVLVGLGYEHYDLDDRIGFGSAPPLSLARLNYGQQSIASVDLFSFHQRQRQDEVGLYAQDQAKWGGFVLTLDGRESWAPSSTHDLVLGTTVNQSDSAFTGRAGLAYLFADGVAPYVSYATNYSPQLGSDASGSPFRAAQGEQEEVGVKYQMPGLPLLASAAVFDVTQSDVLRTDPNNIAFSVATGEVESRGAEAQVTASLGPGWNLTAAYTHLDVTILKGAAGTDGKRLSGIPDDTVSAFGKYTVQPGSFLAGFGIGGGVRILGSSFGDDQNTFRSASAALFDGVVDYDFALLDRKYAGLRLQVNATNLFDTRRVACQGGLCFEDARRQVIGSLVYRW